jgi:hypothetical protein
MIEGDLQGNGTAVEITGPRKIIIPRIQLCPLDPTIPFQLCRRQFAIKITPPMKISKAQRDGVHLPLLVLFHDHLYVGISRILFVLQ